MEGFYSRFKSINNDNMLSQAIIERNAENRRAERIEIPLASIVSRMSLKITKIWWSGCSSSNCLNITLFSQPQSCDYLKLDSPTKYLSRTYLDATLHCSPEMVPEDLPKLAMTCISLAIKFIHNEVVNDSYPPQYLYSLVDLKVSGADSAVLMDKVMSALDCKLLSTTPFDFYSIFFHFFPSSPELSSALDHILDIALVLPSACQYKAEEIFYGSVLAILEYKGLDLIEFQKKVLQALTDCWVRARQVKRLILSEIKKSADSTRQQ